MTQQFDLLGAIQSRAARAAVGPSTVRGKGMTGVVEASRAFLRGVSLGDFSTTSGAKFCQRLDRETERLRTALPRGVRYWGVARKVLNIFLRDSIYTVYLRDAHDLSVAESFLEIPLDSVTAEQLIAGSGGRLPKWCGVKAVTASYNAIFQAEASRVATQLGTSRLHLDAYWWSVGRDAPVR
jgi:hypothetical protein